MEVIAEEVEQGIKILNQRFIGEAIAEWDEKVGMLPCFEAFIKEVVQDKWEDYASRN